jgi:hypothetical protein
VPDMICPLVTNAAMVPRPQRKAFRPISWRFV